MPHTPCIGCIGESSKFSPIWTILWVFIFQVYLFKIFYFILYALVLCLYMSISYDALWPWGLEMGVGPSDSEVMDSCHVNDWLGPQAHCRGRQYFWLLNHLSTHPFPSILLRGMHCYFLQFLEVSRTIQCSLPMKMSLSDRLLYQITSTRNTEKENV